MIIFTSGFVFWKFHSNLSIDTETKPKKDISQSFKTKHQKKLNSAIPTELIRSNEVNLQEYSALFPGTEKAFKNHLTHSEAI